MSAETCSFRLECNVKVEKHDLKGSLLWSHQGHNLVVDLGINFCRDLIGGDISKDPTHIAVGTGNSVPNASDTQLDIEVFRKIITARIKADKKITFQLFIDTDEANGNTLEEAGLFNENNGLSTMWARFVFAPVVKDALSTLTITWELSLAAI